MMSDIKKKLHYKLNSLMQVCMRCQEALGTRTTKQQLDILAKEAIKKYPTTKYIPLLSLDGPNVRVYLDNISTNSNGICWHEEKGHYKGTLIRLMVGNLTEYPRECNLRLEYIDEYGRKTKLDMGRIIITSSTFGVSVDDIITETVYTWETVESKVRSWE